MGDNENSLMPSDMFELSMAGKKPPPPPKKCKNEVTKKAICTYKIIVCSI